MKKLCIFILAASPFVLQFCSSSKNVVKSPAITYTANVKPLMVANCSPCHFPPKGNKKAYDSYTAVKMDIDSILRRVHLNPNQKGFMPFKKAKLSDSTINVLAQWKKDGLLEN